MGFDEGPQLERVKRSDNRRWPLLAIGLGVVLVALATLQPWSTSKPTPSDATSTADGSHGAGVAGQATGDLPAVDPLGLYPQCFPSTDWRVASLQQTITLKVRTAWPVAAAPLPSAPAATTPTLFGSGVEAIGFCMPGMDELTRTQYVSDVSLWRQKPSGSVVLVADAGVLDPALAAQGEVYLTPPASISADGTWPPGDYFFQVRPRGSAPGTNAASSRWLAMRLVTGNRSEASPPPVGRSPTLGIMHSE